ncbi:MAG TPA: universal stress protein [Pilimelia sp.]|nr:universal stress protein [Pilimelia sp.]
MATPSVVVGFDGSPSAHTALCWAMDEATRHGAPVRLVYALEPRPGATSPTPGKHPGSGERRRAQTMLAEAATEAAHSHRSVEVTRVVLDGPAAAVLCEQSRDARMLMLGARGRDGFAGLLVGSVSLAVAAHAHCPVIVIRDTEPTPAQGRPVVVGVDDSPQAQPAIGFAAEEAAARGVGLLAVHAWTPPPTPWCADVRPLVADMTDLQATEEQVLTAALHGWSDKHPTVPMAGRLVPHDARYVLAVASRDAQLVVVGRRATSGPHGVRLVSQYLLHHAACPVAVVPDDVRLGTVAVPAS